MDKDPSHDNTPSRFKATSPEGTEVHERPDPVGDEEIDVSPEILEGLRSGDPIQMVRAIRAVSLYSGPIPPPEYVERYDNLVEGGAERIFSVWEDQSAHRISLEARGQNYAFILVFSALTVAVICAALDQPWVASAIGISAFAGIGVTGIINLIRGRI